VYIVQPGDSLAVIAQKFLVSVDETVELNSINASDPLQPNFRVRKQGGYRWWGCGPGGLRRWQVQVIGRLVQLPQQPPRHLAPTWPALSCEPRASAQAAQVERELPARGHPRSAACRHRLVSSAAPRRLFAACA
jgi:hypothetical protein